MQCIKNDTMAVRKECANSVPNVCTSDLISSLDLEDKV